MQSVNGQIIGNRMAPETSWVLEKEPATPGPLVDELFGEFGQTHARPKHEGNLRTGPSVRWLASPWLWLDTPT